ncbi:MAG TPA: iron ABC transporter permease [Anaerolineae bacterium]|nr:iron ABC transporter permease [Anaerolineae bacterium]
MTAKSSFTENLRRRYREFAIIAQDPVLWMSLLFCGIFLFIFIFYPILRTAANGFFTAEGQASLEHFARYFSDYYGPLYRKIFANTLLMGGLAATFSTLVGFIFAYTMVRCNPPGKRLIHILALTPTVSPPFAVALSAVLLFGRNGLITRKLLGMEFPQGANDIYGMDGLVFVQTITFFSAAYLILRAMLERLDPSMEEAAESMGANRFHIFRTVTLPLLIPGLAGAFMLLFVESLADLGNPLFISGNVSVLATQIFLAVAGEYDYQKASTLALVLLIPTLIVFLLQRYYVTRRSYISVTGKPTGGHVVEKEPWIRWPFILATYLFCALIVLLYLAIIYSSFCQTWGVDFSLTLEWWQLMLTRGIEAVLDTTFLSLLATPFAVLIGMIIAFLVVRKRFSGKEALDFVSNLGGAVPGTILGIGFVLAFSTPPMIVVVLLYLVLAFFLARTLFHERRPQIIVLLLGSAVGVGLSFLDGVLGLVGMYYLLGGAVAAAGLVLWLKQGQRRGRIWVGLGAYLLAYNLIEFVAMPIATLSRSLPRGFWSNAIFQVADHIKVLFQLPPTLMTIVLVFAGVLLIQPEKGRGRVILATFILAVTAALSFTAMPLTLVGTPFIILMAYAVRSLPASVRSGVAALQQIDPAIEEASNSLGADAQYTFRKVTLPLILPALLAGMIFSFTRHMTSVSAIIFLVSARWRIVTAAIMSEWEQGGISIAAAYSTTIILFVLVAIGGLYFVTNRVLRSREYGVESKE